MQTSPRKDSPMFRRLAVAALAAVAMLAVLLPGAALAMGRDRNHDRLPDRWERAHGLSLEVKQGRRDQDHDGLRNAAEYRFHTNPRDADSDDDGVRDGDEHAGTVKAFDGTLLTLALARGGTLAAEVVAGVTQVECEDGLAHASAVAADDPAHGHGADDPAGDDRGTAGHGADD